MASEKGVGQGEGTIKDEGDETSRIRRRLCTGRGRLERREEKRMLSRVNLLFTGVAKHKFPSRRSLPVNVSVPPLNVSALDTTYLPEPHSLADEYTVLLFF